MLILFIFYKIDFVVKPILIFFQIVFLHVDSFAFFLRLFLSILQLYRDNYVQIG